MNGLGSKIPSGSTVSVTHRQLVSLETVTLILNELSPGLRCVTENSGSVCLFVCRWRLDTGGRMQGRVTHRDPGTRHRSTPLPWRLRSGSVLTAPAPVLRATQPPATLMLEALLTEERQLHAL